MSLAVPPPNRSRASSTNLRPALTINTLGRRRSSTSLVLPVLQSDTPTTPQPPAASSSPTPPPSQPSMFALIASKCIELLHVSKKHSIDWSTPSSPYASSDDDLVLPLSSSSQKTTFGDISDEKQSSRSHRSWLRTPAVGFFYPPWVIASRSHLSQDPCTCPVCRAPVPVIYSIGLFGFLLAPYLCRMAPHPL